MPPPTPHRTHAAAPLDAALVWFRRDLRAHDHAALYHALRSARHVWCAFVFDRDILDALSSRGLTADRRVEFIRDSLVQLDEALAALGRGHGRDGVRLLVRHGHAVEEIDRLARELHVQAVYANHDDEPAALHRDAQVRGVLARRRLRRQQPQGQRAAARDLRRQHLQPEDRRSVRQLRPGLRQVRAGLRDLHGHPDGVQAGSEAGRELPGSGGFELR